MVPEQFGKPVCSTQCIYCPLFFVLFTSCWGKELHQTPDLLQVVGNQSEPTGFVPGFAPILGQVKKPGKSLSVVENGGCALAAGGLAALIGNPADLALIRMQACSLPPWVSTLSFCCAQFGPVWNFYEFWGNRCLVFPITIYWWKFPRWMRKSRESTNTCIWMGKCIYIYIYIIYIFLKAPSIL